MPEHDKPAGEMIVQHPRIVRGAARHHRIEPSGSTVDLKKRTVFLEDPDLPVDPGQEMMRAGGYHGIGRKG